MGFKNMKRDDHGHVISNDETDGQKCQHASGGSVKQDVFDDDYDEEFDKHNNEMKKAQEELDKKSESLNNIPDRENRKFNFSSKYGTPSRINRVNDMLDELLANGYAQESNTIQGMTLQYLKDMGVKAIPDPSGGITIPELKKQDGIPHKPVDMPKYHWDKDHIVIDEDEENKPSGKIDDDFLDNMNDFPAIRKNPKTGEFEVDHDGDGNWSVIDEDEYNALKKKGYQEIDYEEEPEAKDDDDLEEGLDELEELVPDSQKNKVKKIKKDLIGDDDKRA